jgi:hypothetical protein
MYIIKPEEVARVKLTKHAWEDEYAREISMRWIHTIRLLMGFRTAITLVVAWFTWGISSATGKNADLIQLISSLQYWFCVVNFVLDAYLMFGLIGTYRKHMRFVKNPQDPILKKSALIHQSPQTPLTVQTILFSPGIIYMILTMLL